MTTGPDGHSQAERVVASARCVNHAVHQVTPCAVGVGEAGGGEVLRVGGEGFVVVVDVGVVDEALDFFFGAVSGEAAEGEPVVPVGLLDFRCGAEELVGDRERASGREPGGDVPVERGFVLDVVEAHAGGDEVEGTGREGEVFEAGGDGVHGRHKSITAPRRAGSGVRLGVAASDGTRVLGLKAGLSDGGHFGGGVDGGDLGVGVFGCEAEGEVAGAAPELEDAGGVRGEVGDEAVGHFVVAGDGAADEGVVAGDHGAEVVGGGGGSGGHGTRV